jgi:hypothetical protein
LPPPLIAPVCDFLPAIFHLIDEIRIRRSDSVSRNTWIRQVDDGLRSACEQFEPLRKRRAAMAYELEKPGEDKAALFQQVEPDAKDELVRRQMIGPVARKIVHERRNKRFAKEQEQRQERDRSGVRFRPMNDAAIK